MNIKKKNILIVLLSLVFGGCATSYQNSTFSISGGYSNQKVTKSLEKISFTGNAYTKTDVVIKYALYRSAEFANENNKPYFLMFASLRHAAKLIPTAMPIFGSIGKKTIAYSYVLLLDENQTGARSTAEIMEQLNTASDNTVTK